MEAGLGISRYPQGDVKKEVHRLLVRYADDFLVFCNTKAEAEQAQSDLQRFLSLRGLQLSEEKTRIVHLMEGFDFLGYNVRHYATPHTRKGWKLLIQPAQRSVMAFREKLRHIFRQLHGSNAKCLIKVLNPILRGWANYYRNVSSSETFSKLEHYIFWKLRRWISKTHPTKSFSWRDRQYWANHLAYPGSQWSFVDPDTNMVLYRIGYTRFQRHTLIQGKASPDDPDFREYFEERARQSRQIEEYPKAVQRIIRQQRSKCPHCGESLFNEEDIHVHHKIPRKQGGTNHSSNLVAVHLVCHAQLHREA